MTGFSPSVRQGIKTRAKDACERCCRPIFSWSPHEIHHRRPRGMGGSKDPLTNSLANGVLLCPPCHRFIEAHRDKARSLGWLVRQGQAPTEAPLYYHGSRWVVLTLDGEILETASPTHDRPDPGPDGPAG